MTLLQVRLQCLLQMHKLFFCLSRYLATGDSFYTISDSYRIGHSTVQGIVHQVCQALWDTLHPVYMRPLTTEEWRIIADDYEQLWQFPNCIRALDGKHVMCKKTPCSGSLFYNYKEHFSVVLLALVDAHYCFIMVDVGTFGRNSDGAVFNHSAFGQCFMNGMTIVADDAFSLRPDLMKPFPGRKTGLLTEGEQIFNYHLSHTRIKVENAFGILSQCWRLYQRKMDMHADNITPVILATYVLHNYLQKP